MAATWLVRYNARMDTPTSDHEFAGAAFKHYADEYVRLNGGAGETHALKHVLEYAVPRMCSDIIAAQSGKVVMYRGTPIRDDKP